MDGEVTIARIARPIHSPSRYVVPTKQVADPRRLESRAQSTAGAALGPVANFETSPLGEVAAGWRGVVRGGTRCVVRGTWWVVMGL